MPLYEASVFYGHAEWSQVMATDNSESTSESPSGKRPGVRSLTSWLAGVD